MAIYRGIGGAGDSTTDATITAVTEQAANAAASASAAASSATAAASSATAASTAQTAAETAETAAETAQAAAETAETNAETAESNAAASASAAATSASNASTSETNAATSATSASTSATAAASSATSAASSATSASTSASNASTSETNAASSASSASTSATNAATSATNASSSATSASTSATNAASSASSAAASYDDFDDRYLGAKSSAPSLDNDGDPLVTGALYFDTTSGAMKVYNGSSWLDAYASLSGALIATNNLSDLNDAATARTNLGLGTAATTASTDYATAAQGSLADSATQPGDNISTLTNDSGFITASDNITGNAATATTATNADKIYSNNHSFYTPGYYYIPFLNGSGAYYTPYLDSNLQYNPYFDYLILTGTFYPNVIDFADGTSTNEVLRFGNSDDARLYYDGTNNTMEMMLGSSTNSFIIVDNGLNVKFTFDKSTGNFTATGDVTGANLNVSNWDTAYGWGNHASAGYLTNINGESIEDLSDVNTMTPTDGQVLTWDNANSRWDAADVSISHSQLPSGSVLQVVSFNTSSQGSVSLSSSDVALSPDITKSITPIGNNSKFLIQVRWAGEVQTGAQWNSLFNIHRDGSRINSPGTNQWQGLASPGLLYYGANDSSTGDQMSLSTLDTTGSTAGTAITYRLVASSANSNAYTYYTNRTYDSSGGISYEAWSSEIIITEIKA